QPPRFPGARIAVRRMVSKKPPPERPTESDAPDAPDTRGADGEAGPKPARSKAAKGDRTAAPATPKRARTGKPGGKPLVIVESPAKAKTIGKILGPGYLIEASIGHVRDLPNGADEIPEAMRKEKWARLGIDIEHD